MKKRIFPLVAVALFLLMSGFAVSALAGSDSAGRQDVLYVCNCGDACNCGSMSTEPGDCQCGKPMKWHHVVKVEGDEALLCTCAEGCKCKINTDDPSTCACGNPVKRVSLKDSGIYFCNCGGECACNTISSQPGDCKCGMKLKQM